MVEETYLDKMEKKKKGLNKKTIDNIIKLLIEEKIIKKDDKKK